MPDCVPVDHGRFGAIEIDVVQDSSYQFLGKTIPHTFAVR